MLLRIVEHLRADISAYFKGDFQTPIQKAWWRFLPPGPDGVNRLGKVMADIRRRYPNLTFDEERLQYAHSLKPAQVDSAWERAEAVMRTMPAGITARDLYNGGRVCHDAATARRLLTAWQQQGRVTAFERKPGRRRPPDNGLQSRREVAQIVILL